MGQQRLGPDLANVGARLTDRQWHLKHLYHPRSVVTQSGMPAYTYLFDVQPIGEEPSPDALALEGEYAPEEGMEVVPKPEALALVDYLLSLKIETLCLKRPTCSLKPSRVKPTTLKWSRPNEQKPKKSNPSKKSSNDREPGVSKAPISVIFFVVTVLLAYWAMMELNTRAGGFNRYVYGPYESYKVVEAVQPGSGDDLIKRGADIYRNICSPATRPQE